MKKTCLFLIILFLSFVLFLQNLLASDYTKWHLPEGAKTRIGKGYIIDLAYFPDGSKIAVATPIGIWIYDAKTGKELDLLIGQKGNIVSGPFLPSIACSPDGTTIVCGSSNKNIYLWSVATGQHLKTFEVEGWYAYSVCFSPDGSKIACSDGANTYLWDITTSKLLHTFTGLFNSVCFSPDGSKIASGDIRGFIYLLDVSTGAEVRRLEGHDGRVRSVCFSPDGSKIASAAGLASGNRATVKVWDVITGKTLHTFKGYGLNVCFSPDGTTLASGNGSRVVSLRDVTKGQLQKTISGHADALLIVRYSPDGTTLASGGGGADLCLWDATTGRLQKTIRGHTDSFSSVRYSPDGTTVAGGSVEPGGLCLWDSVTGLLQKTIFLQKDKIDYLSRVSSVCYSPDGTTIAAGSRYENVWLLDVATKKLLKTLIAKSLNVGNVSFSPNGQMLACVYHAPWNNDYKICLWDIATEKIQKTLYGHTSFLNSVCFSPDGSILASGSADKTIRLWNPSTGQHLKTIAGHTGSVNSIRFSPDGSTLASGSEDKTIRLWNPSTGQHLDTFIGHTGVSSLCFSSDGQVIASGGNNGEILLWSTSTGQHLKTLAGHTARVGSVCFSPNGQTLVSSSMVVLLWNTGILTPQPQPQDSPEESKQQVSTPLTPQQIAKKALAATVLIVMEDVNGKPLGSGSGFFIGKGLIATNYHIAEKGTRKTYKRVGKDKWYNITDTVKVDKQRDLAILKVSDVDTPALPLGNSDEVQIGQSVYAVGNPIGFLEGTFAPGFVSSIRGKEPNKSIQITAPISPGSSGGPLLNDKGEVVGIIVGGITEGQNLNFAIPSNYLKELLDKVRKIQNGNP